MRFIAVIQANLEVNPLGTRNRLAHEISGVPVLRRTVERAARIKGVEALYVLCPQDQTAACERLLAGSSALIRPYNAPSPPWGVLVQTARKWSLDGWRGGLGGTTHFDEFFYGRLVAGLLQGAPADAVLAIHPAAALFDPILADQMIDHFQKNRTDIGLTFTQSPPGISGVVLDATAITEIAEKDIPIGWVFSYKPDTPTRDLSLQACCCEVPADVRYAAGRTCADTRRSAERVAALLREHEDPDAATVGRWLQEREATAIEPLPREVELELTVDTPYPDALLRPRGQRVGTRDPIDVGLVQHLAAELVTYDDSLLVLGGFGDPLRHPRFVDVLKAVRGASYEGRGIYGLAVRTTVADLTDEHIDALIEYQVDVLEVELDAWSAALYGQLQSPGDAGSADLEKVKERITRLTAASRDRKSVKPIVVPSMIKARPNVHELDDFHDGWLRHIGAVCVTGYSHRAGQCEDLSVINMAPSPRTSCRRLRSRCMVLCDGRVTLCDQDFKGLHALGDLGKAGLGDIWRSAAYEGVRGAHGSGCFDTPSLCAACDEWHRP